MGQRPAAGRRAALIHMKAPCPARQDARQRVNSGWGMGTGPAGGRAATDVAEARTGRGLSSVKQPLR